MKWSRWARAPLAAGVAALALAGCASAAATTAAATTSAARSSVAIGRATVMLYSINSDGPDFRAIVVGAIGDYGPAVILGAARSEVKLSLTRGSFQLSIATLNREFVRATSHEPIYPRTCSDLVSVRAAVPIVAGSGTGAYRNIRGNFTMTATLHEVQVKPCQHVNVTAWQAIVLSGPGTISLG